MSNWIVEREWWKSDGEMTYLQALHDLLKLVIGFSVSSDLDEAKQKILDILEKCDTASAEEYGG